MKTPLTQFSFPVLTVLALLSSPLASAQLYRGQVHTPAGDPIDYLYDGERNTFGLDVRPLMTFRTLTRDYQPVPDNLCKIWRAHLADGNRLQADELESLHPSSPLQIKMEVSAAYNSPYYAEEVQKDLRSQGKTIKLPVNTTYLNRNLFRLNIRWNEDAISQIGKADLVSTAESRLRAGFNLDSAEDKSLTLTVNVPRAPAYLRCDLQDKKVILEAQYEFQNGFISYDHGKVTAGVVKSLWNGVAKRTRLIDEAAEQASMLDRHQARLVAASSLLTLEIEKTASKSELLKPGVFLKIFEKVFSFSPVAPRADLRDVDVSEFADRMGKPVDTVLNKFEGKVVL